MKWIVKQRERVPRYIVEAPEFEMDENGNVIFLSDAGSFIAAISEVSYIKPDDNHDSPSVTVYDEED